MENTNEITVKERIREFIDYLGITERAFTMSINVSQSYVSNISRSMGIEVISTIKLTYPQLNIEWLLTGVGDMIHPDFDENHTENDEKCTEIDKKTQFIQNPNNSLIEALQAHISDLQAERDRLLDERKELKSEIDFLRGADTRKKETA